MELNTARNDRLERPELLLVSLIDCVSFALDTSVHNQSVFLAWSVVNHLHVRVKLILRHGAKIKHHLIYGQKTYAAFDIWLENCIQDHSLARVLKTYRCDVLGHYSEWAFLQNDELFESLIECLYVLSTRDYKALIIVNHIQCQKVLNKVTKLVGLEMPLVGSSVLVDYDGDDLTKIRQPRKVVYSDSISIVAVNTHRSPPTIVEDVASEDSATVPTFTYAIHASPVSVTDLSSDVPQSISRRSEEREKGRKSRDSGVGGATKSFLESGGLIQPPAFGNFPLPHEGQTLTSFLSSLSNSMPELDRENAHFNVSEALISAFERLRAKEQEDHYHNIRRYEEEMCGSPYGSCRRKKQRYRRQPFLQHTETEESEKEYWKQYPRRPPSHMKKRKKCSPELGSDGQSESFCSNADLVTSHSSSPDSSEDELVSSFSAENVALNLLRNAKIKDVEQSDASKLQWMVTEVDAPQNLLPMPKNWGSTPDFSTETSCGVLDTSMRLRGTTDWAPPRAQIIFTIHPPPNLQNLMEVQKYRCAGCGTKVEPKYASTFRYCNYLGRYFCTGCHTMKKVRLPQLILHKWDFSPYLVSNFSATLLESLQSDPVYNIMAINPNLLKKVRINNFRNFRIQLGYLSQYLRNCKAASALLDDMAKFPTYYSCDVDLYSLQDLVELRFSMGLPLKTKEFVSQGISHVLHCELCKQLGFVCEICKRDEVIFPFQLNRVTRCPKCLSCFHLKCFTPGKTKCLKCYRLTVRNSAAVELV